VTVLGTLHERVWRIRKKNFGTPHVQFQINTHSARLLPRASLTEPCLRLVFGFVSSVSFRRDRSQICFVDPNRASGWSSTYRTKYTSKEHNYYYISRRFKRRNWSFHRFTEFLLLSLFFFSNLHSNECGGMPGGAVHMHDNEKARN
jgi:hypothetical protein